MADREIKITIKGEGAKGGGIGGAVSGLLGKGKAGGGLLAGLGGGAGAAGGIAGAMGAIAGPLAIIAGGMALLVASSKFLQKTLSRMVGLFLRLVRPIGDVVATLLQPLIILMVPVVRAFALLMRPFQRVANTLLRQGARLISMGEEEAGFAAIFEGVKILFKPFINLFLTGFVEGLIIGLDRLLFPFELMIQAFDFLTGGVLGLHDQFIKFKEGGVDVIRAALSDWIKTSDKEWLASANAMALNATKTVNEVRAVQDSITLLGGAATVAAKQISEAADRIAAREAALAAMTIDVTAGGVGTTDERYKIDGFTPVEFVGFPDGLPE